MQELIVTLIVACATWTVAKRYLPKAARNAVRAGVARTAGKLGWQGLAKRLQAPVLAAQGCGSGCGSCGSCEPPVTRTDGQRILIKKI